MGANKGDGGRMSSEMHYLSCFWRLRVFPEVVAYRSERGKSLHSKYCALPPSNPLASLTLRKVVCSTGSMQSSMRRHLISLDIGIAGMCTTEETLHNKLIPKADKTRACHALRLTGKGKVNCMLQRPTNAARRPQNIGSCQQ